MNKILLQNMMFYGYHGVYEYEREQGQRFYVDVELCLDPVKAAQTDEVRDTVDYVAIYMQVKAIFETKRFNLLESLAEYIAGALITGPIHTVTVRVRKPGVPFPGHIDFVQFEATKSREK